MQSQTERINLQYERGELKQILRYATAHDVERNGRYDLPILAYFTKEPCFLCSWLYNDS